MHLIDNLLDNLQLPTLLCRNSALGSVISEDAMHSTGPSLNNFADVKAPLAATQHLSEERSDRYVPQVPLQNIIKQVISRMCMRVCVRACVCVCEA